MLLGLRPLLDVVAVKSLFDEQVELALERLVDELLERFAVQRDEPVDPLVDPALTHPLESTTLHSSA